MARRRRAPGDRAARGRRGRPLLARHGDHPNTQVPPEWHGKVLHARMEVGGAVLMGADIPSAEPMRSAYLTLRPDTEAEAERIYAALADGGEVFMKLEKTFFANRFAMLLVGSFYLLAVGLLWAALEAPTKALTPALVLQILASVGMLGVTVALLFAFRSR